MKRIYRTATTALIAMVCLSTFACGDKILVAKTALTAMAFGFQTAKSVVTVIAEAKRAECAKLGAVGTEAFDKCFAKTAKMVEATDKMWPQADQLLITTGAAIRAYEQKLAGESVDFATPLKQGVCLLTKLSTWMPEKYRKKIEVFLALAVTYTCDVPAARIGSPERQRRLAIAMVILLRELGAQG